jgi:eukaryotic-like serine/threonine-protein kinase
MRAPTARRSGWAYVAVAAVLAATSAVSVRVWPVALTSGIAAAASVIIGVWVARGSAISRDDAEWHRTRARAVRLDEYGAVPLIRDLNNPIAVGVHPAAALDSGDRARSPAFIDRDVTTLLVETILRDRFVVVIGESTAGKTRVAYEAVRALFPDRRLVEPLDRSAVEHALETAIQHPGCVMWLDDLERFLGRGGLTGIAVDSLLAAPGRARFILATMRAEEHAKFTNRAGHSSEELSGESLRQSREVLYRATRVDLPRAWSQVELARAALHRTDPRVAEALAHSAQFGLAEYLAAGPQLLADWRDAWAPGLHPRGAALVVAAVDARRAGLHRPLPIALLEQLHLPYLRHRGGEMLRPEPLAEALAWAMTPLHATSSLLIPADDGGLLAFDYLIDSIRREPIPSPALDALVAYATADEAVDIADAAWMWNCLDQAEAAFTAAEPGDRQKAFAGRYYVILERDGTGAALAYAYHMLAQRNAAFGPDARETLCARRLIIWEEGDLYKSDAAVVGKALARMTDLYHAVSRILGDDYEDALETRRMIAHLTAMAGKPANAADIAQRLEADCSRVLGPLHEMTRSCGWMHADFVGEAGEPDKAVALFEQMVARFRQASGDMADARVWIAHGYARSLTKAGRHVDAIDAWERLVSELSRSHGELHNDTLNARRELADSIGHGGDPGRAVELLRQLLASELVMQQPGGLGVLALQRDIACWTGEAGQPEQAVHQLRLLAEISAEQRGETDYYTVRLRQLLAEWVDQTSAKGLVRIAAPRRPHHWE